ncbi:MAG: type II toxin-antitoxin system RelE/ParE family toxin [Lachnospiraceae bacterium]|nr:type II toxin-antitoxin system RelE/ParE family toxin [Lachnospiraceae bacterium]
MHYKLIITERAEELLDGLVRYLLYRIKNQQAALHLLESIEKLYDRLEYNPFQYPFCKDEYLLQKEYREAVLTDMNYLVIYKVEDENVYVLGVFHELEQYKNKL